MRSKFLVALGAIMISAAFALAKSAPPWKVQGCDRPSREWAYLEDYQGGPEVFALITTGANLEEALLLEVDDEGIFSTEVLKILPPPKKEDKEEKDKGEKPPPTPDDVMPKCAVSCHTGFGGGGGKPPPKKPAAGGGDSSSGGAGDTGDGAGNTASSDGTGDTASSGTGGAGDTGDGAGGAGGETPAPPKAGSEARLPVVQSSARAPSLLVQWLTVEELKGRIEQKILARDPNGVVQRIKAACLRVQVGRYVVLYATYEKRAKNILDPKAGEVVLMTTHAVIGKKKK